MCLLGSPSTIIFIFFLRLSQRRSQLTRGVTIKRNTLPSSLLLTTILTGNVRYNLFNFSFTTSQQIIFKQILINTFCWENNHCNGYNFMRIIDCRTPHFRGRKIRAEFDIRVEQAEFQDVRVRAGSSQGVLVTVREDRAGLRPARCPVRASQAAQFLTKKINSLQDFQTGLFAG